MGIEQEGSLSFRMNHADADWATNAKPYEFPPVQAGTISATVVKHPTRRIEIRVRGALGSELVFDGPIPPVRPEGLSVTVTWSAQQVRLYFDGRLFKTAQIPGGTPGNGAGDGDGGELPA